jgi:putative ABC transport system permease protein
MEYFPAWIEAIVSDIRFALRSWRKSPGAIALAICTLAVAIGSTTVIFSVVKAILLNQLPYRDPARLVELNMDRGTAQRSVPPSLVTLSDLRTQSHLIESISVYGDSQNVTLEHGQARVLRGMRVSWDFFQTLGAQIQFGRTFLPDEELLGHDHEIILTHALWLDLFGGDPDAIGRTLDSSSLRAKVRVIGVLPANFHAPHMSNPIEWPQYFMPLGRDPGDDQCRSCGGSPAIARITRGATVPQAQAELNAITAKLVREYPNDYPEDSVVRLTPLRDAFVGRARSILWIVLAAVVFVLLIAAANLANLLLARATARGREIAIRAALGSGRGRIIRQLLTESLLLSLIAGAAGVMLAYWAISVLGPIAPREIPRVDEIRIDSSILLFGLVVSLATGALFGLAPALRASRTDLIDAIKQSAAQGARRDHSKLRDLLVISQIALAFVLVIGTALLSRSLFLLINVNPGFDFHNVLTLSMIVYGKQDWDAAMNYYRQVTGRVKAIPGVDGVAMVQEFPLSLSKRDPFAGG